MSEPFEMTHRRAIDILAHAGIGINDNDVVAPILVAGVIWNGWKMAEWCRDLIREIPEKEDDAMEEPTRDSAFRKLVSGTAWGDRIKKREEMESAIDLLATNPAAYGFPEESGDLPERKDGFVGARSPNIQEGMRYKGGVNPPSTMPRPSEPPKPFDPRWKAPATREEAEIATATIAAAAEKLRSSRSEKIATAWRNYFESRRRL